MPADNQQSDSSDHERRLEELLAELIRSLEAGETPDQSKMLAQHPEFASELKEFFEQREQLNRMVQPLRQVAGRAFTLQCPHCHKNIEIFSEDEPTVHCPSCDTDFNPTPTLDATRAQFKPTVRRFGDYELLDEIARGGMGVVYRARQIKLNRIVALKMILSGHLASEDEINRFHSEAEAAAKLDHPGIVPIHDIGEHEGQHYFSMAFVEGESLAEKMKQGPLPTREVVRQTKKIVEAIQYAHERGVIHRDLMS
jgi:serine/threonine-protein kinase